MFEQIASALVDGVVADLKGMGVDASGDLQAARMGHQARALLDAATATSRTWW